MEMPSDTIIAKLEELKIAYRKLEHEPIYTVDAGLEIAEKLEVLPCKCLLLRTRKKEYYMILLSGNKHLSSKELAVQIGCSHLSFASKEELGELLHAEPGAVSPLGLLFDTDNRIRLLIDTEVAESEYFACHPNDNTCSLRIKTADILEIYLPAVNHMKYEDIFIR